MIARTCCIPWLQLLLALSEDAARPNAPDAPGSPTASVKPAAGGPLSLFPTVLQPDATALKQQSENSVRSLLGVVSGFSAAIGVLLIDALNPCVVCPAGWLLIVGCCYCCCRRVQLKSSVVSHLGVQQTYVRLTHATLVTRIALSALSDASGGRVLRRYDAFEVVRERC